MRDLPKGKEQSSQTISLSILKPGSNKEVETMRTESGLFSGLPMERAVNSSLSGFAVTEPPLYESGCILGGPKARTA